MFKKIRKKWYFKKVKASIRAYSSVKEIKKVTYLEDIKAWINLLDGDPSHKKWIIAWFDLIQENLLKKEPGQEIKSSALDLIFNEEVRIQRMLSMKEVCVHLSKMNHEWVFLEHDLLQILRRYLFKNHVFADEWGIVTFYSVWSKKKIEREIQWEKVIVSKKIILAMSNEE